MCDSERHRKQSGAYAASCAKKEATRKGKQIQPRPLAFARDGIVFATFREPAFTASQVLERCRVRWQVEPLFKRFKSPAQLGHVPKYDDSARAWLYGKLLVALLAEKLIRHARESLKNSYRDSGIYGNPLISRSSKRFKQGAMEFFSGSFMLDQAARAIAPRFPLAQASGEWDALSTALAEPPRRRLA